MNPLVNKRCSPIEEMIYQDGFQAWESSRDAEVHRLQMALADTEALELGTSEKCDQLREQVALLREALHDAATSLETIAVRSYGEESYLDSKQQMRGYAGARAGVAREALAATEPKP